jgi:CyaY protein
VERQDFLRRADECLARAAERLEAFDPDEVDFSTSDGVVSIEFPDGVRYILNRQTAADQMWLAAGARAWHYGWDAGRGAWLDDRDGHELFERLSRAISAKIGREVAL